MTITLNEYYEWARDTLRVDFQAESTKSLFALNQAAALSRAQETEFWRALGAELDAIGARYRTENAAELFSSSLEPTLSKKPYESAVEKTYRKNVLLNENFPNERSDGWITASNLFEKLDDLLRTTVVCNYLDGPELVSTSLRDRAEASGFGTNLRVHSSDFGHYAYHLYVGFPMDIALASGGSTPQVVQVEFQVTTQPQQLLHELTHPYYKEQRSQPSGARDNWRWEYTEPAFKARYLCHALHLLEAMILEVRDNRVRP